MPAKKSSTAIIRVEVVQRCIYLIRGQRVILDTDLARLYDVTTKQLNQAVKRNVDRFPDDFMFQLTWEEAEILRSQIVTLSASPDRKSQNFGVNTSKTEDSLRSQIVTLKHGTHIKYRPYVFTEHGVLMAANVLRSTRASKASVFVVRAFVKLRELLATHHQFAAKLEALERKLQDHDGQFTIVFEAIRELMDQKDEPPKPPIGFATEAAGHKLARRTSRRAQLSRSKSP